MKRLTDIVEWVSLTDDLPSLGAEAVPSVKAMCTLLARRGEDFFLKSRLEEIDIEFISELERSIIHHSQDTENLDDYNIKKLFNSIQVWGGRTGRNIYVKCRGLSDNLDLSSYKALSAVCKKSKSIDEILYITEIFCQYTNHIGFDFVTKHVIFMTYHNEAFGGLPIHDSIISRGLYINYQ